MKNIKNTLICGLGGIGCVCAVPIFESKIGKLKILVDSSRYNRYKNETTYFNNKPYKFDVISPNTTNFKADLIIISTKNDGLEFAIKNIRKFMHKDTIILSLLNGIHSEQKIAEEYGWINILISFYLGHSCIREGRHIAQDGIYNIIIGNKDNIDNENLLAVIDFFNKTGIHYQIPQNIQDEYWKKFIINVGINQLSAATGLTLKEIKQDEIKKQTLISLMKEAELIAEKEGIKNHKNVFNSAVKFLLVDIEDAKTSMLQDIQAGRKTEVDIFSGEVIRLAKKHKLYTPYNQEIYNSIKELERI